jgi:hypothetical protein
MTLHALKIPVRTMAERKLTFGGHLRYREGERAPQCEDLLLHLDVHMAIGALARCGPRVVAASTILEGLNQGSAMRRLHLVAGLTRHLLVLDVTKGAQRVLCGTELLASHQKSAREDDSHRKPRRTHQGGPDRWHTRHPLRLASAARTGSKPGP